MAAVGLPTLELPEVTADGLYAINDIDAGKTRQMRADNLLLSFYGDAPRAAGKRRRKFASVP
jgi:hypothetical protein